MVAMISKVKGDDQKNNDQQQQQKKKIVVIMGATASGKSRLSIDLATRFSPSEIINSDKMQFYKGLDVTTNKMPMHERLGIRHHLIDEFESSHGELSLSDFRSLAAAAVDDITSRNHLPILVGGSNSLIHAFLVEDFNSGSDGSLDVIESVSSELRYRCCFLWVDVDLDVHKKYLCKRVDQMMEAGMFEELADFYESGAPLVGIRKSIGIPEFERYFRFYPPGSGSGSGSGSSSSSSSGGSDGDAGNGSGREDDDGCNSGADVAVKKTMMNGTHLEAEVERRAMFEEAVQAIKDNSYELAKKQVEKIERLRFAGWDIQRLNVTEVIRTAVTSESGEKSLELWEKEVIGSSVKIVKQFLEE